jgi:hypothetical protein
MHDCPMTIAAHLAETKRQRRGSPLEVLLIFLRLGVTCFGGPIAHIGYFHDEFVAVGSTSKPTLIWWVCASFCLAPPAARSDFPSACCALAIAAVSRSGPVLRCLPL